MGPGNLHGPGCGVRAGFIGICSPGLARRRPDQADHVRVAADDLVQGHHRGGLHLVGDLGEVSSLLSSPLHDDDIDSWILAGPLVVAGHDYLVLCAEMDPTLNGGVPCDGWFFRDSQGQGLALSNKVDELVLTRPDGVEIDWLQYQSDWFTPGVATGVDPAFLEGGAHNDGAHWCDQTTIVSTGGEPGTPGLENDPCE